MARSMGGGGGGRSGGGHSSGGAHRSGSRSMGGGHRAGSFSSSSSGHRRPSSSGYSGSRPGPGPGPGSYHGGPGMPPPPPPHRPYRRYYYNRPYYRSGPYYRSAPASGCSNVIATFLLMIIILAIVFTMTGRGIGGGNEKLNRDKYTGDVDSSQGYYIDDSMGSEKFIDRTNEQDLISGFKTFYSRTGVYPFLYIKEYSPDPSEYAGYDTYEDMMYEKLFRSEGNFLIVYIAEEDTYYFAAGYNTGEIIDSQTLDVISRKIDSKWSTGDLAVAFGEGLEDASKNIMAKSNFRVIMIVIIVGVVLIVVVNLLIRWSKKKKELQIQEAEKLEEILDKPLETFGTDMSDLEKKYDDDQNQQS